MRAATLVEEMNPLLSDTLDPLPAASRALTLAEGTYPWLVEVLDSLLTISRAPALTDTRVWHWMRADV